MASLGDRRSTVRFEVVGDLRGTLELPTTARLVNISQTGALVESPLVLPLRSTQMMQFRVDDDFVPVETLVRSIRPGPGDAPPGFLVGVEFIKRPDALQHSIERLAQEGAAGV